MAGKMEVKMKRMNRVIAFSALAALSLTLNPIQAGAYGETTEKQSVSTRHGKTAPGQGKSPLIPARLY